jgi:hypothetical protein
MSDSPRLHQQISVEIVVYKTLLKKLEQDRNLVQRQLNAVLDPISRLPLEISLEIFLLSLAADHITKEHPNPLPRPRADSVLMALMNVSNTWSAIALATPALWTVIRINFPCARGLSRLLPIWFQGARDRPLSIALGGDLTYLGRHLKLWQALEAPHNIRRLHQI